MIITPTSLTINQLFGSNNEQYVIPTYQRRYSWHERQVWELIDDIGLIEGSDTHLLGSIVCLTGHHTAGLNRLELVDGQQRLTTITILLECIRQRLDALDERDEAAEVARLLSAKPLGGQTVRKVALDSIDAAEFDRLVTNDKQREFQNKPLEWAFAAVREWVAEQPLEQLGSFLYRLKNQAIVIRLDVSEAKDAFKLFETINNRGLKLSPTDIIKNFLLGNAARFGNEALQEARASWTLLIEHLDGTNSDAFFRYYLMSLLKVRLTAGDVVPSFKKVFMQQVVEAKALPERHLYADPDEATEEDSENGDDGVVAEVDASAIEQISFKDFLTRLVLSAKIYGELVLVKTVDAETNRHLRNLKMIKAVQTYGFLMHLRAGGCTKQHFREILKLTESFVLRRHVCRERSNETEALFAKLCAVSPTDPIQATRDAYRELCPDDDKFRDEFSAASFTSNVIDRARYCLEQIEMSKHGDHAELQVLGAEDVHVEHIVPQKIKTRKAKEEFGDWVEYLGDKAELRHPRYVSRIGNLTIFAGALNIGASNNPFHKKRQAYKESSIKLTQELSRKSQFKFKDVEQRSTALAEMAVCLWPMP
jgi:hypothetical protein